jgi:hypothetical protein
MSETGGGVARCVAKVHNSVGKVGRLLIGSLVAWYLWVIGFGLASQHKLEWTSAYLVAPIALTVGIVVGSFLRRQWQRDKVIYLVVVVLTATLFSLPIYANASAAVGGLMVALVGLGVLEVFAPTHATQPLKGALRRREAEPSILRQSMVLALVLCAGLLLVIDAQAALVLSVPVAVIIVFAAWKRTGPPQWITVSLGFLVAAGAALAVVFLGSRPSWPDWLASGDSLSSARHTLWSDALSLWATQPLIGSGPGSFTPSSELASRDPSLAAVHSLPLQVGAELGAVGVVLLACLFLTGSLFAARGSRPVAFVAIVAWTALAVHSSIDHLEDFPIVAFMGGVVLGWSGFRPHLSEVFRRTENTVG